MEDGAEYTILNQLNVARFSTPDSDREETKATGRGTIPLIMSRYYATISVVSYGTVLNTAYQLPVNSASEDR